MLLLQLAMSKSWHKSRSTVASKAPLLHCESGSKDDKDFCPEKKSPFILEEVMKSLLRAKTTDKKMHAQQSYGAEKKHWIVLANDE